MGEVISFSNLAYFFVLITCDIKTVGKRKTKNITPNKTENSKADGMFKIFITKNAERPIKKLKIAEKIAIAFMVKPLLVIKKYNVSLFLGNFFEFLTTFIPQKQLSEILMAVFFQKFSDFSIVLILVILNQFNLKFRNELFGYDQQSTRL